MTSAIRNVVLAGSLALCSLPAFAEPVGLFDLLDADRDGALSIDEYAKPAERKDAVTLDLRAMGKPRPGAAPTMFLLPPEPSGKPPEGKTGTTQFFMDKPPPTFEQKRRVLFPAIDADKDGKVTRAEFDQYNTTLLTNGFQKLDINADGQMSAEEYGKLSDPRVTLPLDMDLRYPTTIEFGAPSSDAALKANFASMDKNRDGKVTLQAYLP